MFHWLRELLEIKYEFRERRASLTREVKVEEKICQSCETLKQQLEISNYEKAQLLSKILEKPEVPKETPPVEVSRPRHLPWAVRRQILEKEDRDKAAKLRQAAKPDSETTKESVAELESELNVAEQTREGTATTEKVG